MRLKLNCRFLAYISLLLFTGFSSVLQAQYKGTGEAIDSILLKGDQLFPSWSENGRYLLFQSSKNGNEDIFLYDLRRDSLIQITRWLSNERHPVWRPHYNAVVFDSDKGSTSFLYQYSLKTGKIKPLFNRNIVCSQPSFDPTGHLVCFSGFDKISGTMQIFSYDFVYDNLNKLSNEKGTCVFPIFSHNGSSILYQQLNLATDTVGKLIMCNWYGEVSHRYKQSYALKTNWTPYDWRILFVVYNNTKTGEVYSMRKDGKAIYRITENKYIERCPSVSPNGKIMAIPMKKKKYFNIYLFSVK